MTRYNLLLWVLAGIFLIGCGNRNSPWGRVAPTEKGPANQNPEKKTEPNAPPSGEPPSQEGTTPNGTDDTYGDDTYDYDDYDPYSPGQPTPPSSGEANEPGPVDNSQTPPDEEVTTVPVTSFAEVQPLFVTYCAMCHPATSPPDWQDYAAAKAYVDNGKLYEKIWILYQSNDPLAMPLSNVTGMTEEERQQIIKWIDGGGAE